MTYRNRIIQGDVLEVLKTLPSEKVDCVVTSPPYWGLRDYGVEGQLGLEKTPQEFISRTVEIFREVWRVLKPEGTCWVNMGDSYAASGGDRHNGSQGKNSVVGHTSPESNPDKRNRPKEIGLKPKDLVGIPWMLAFALRDDGWYLRQDIIWSKKNPMPESVTDRCTKSHEYLFLLTKSAKYYWDQEAVREKTNGDDVVTWESRKANGEPTRRGMRDIEFGKDPHLGTNPNGRNIRSVWNISTQSFPDAHFATFPEKLVEPCIKAGTSEKGYCPECGKPWVRQIKKKLIVMPEKTLSGWQRGPGSHDKIPKGRYYGEEYSGKCGDLKPQEASRRMLLNVKARRDSGEEHDNPFPPSKTLGWRPSCTCSKDPIPGLVMDPFGGAMTTAVVAKRLLRDYLCIELNPTYCEMGQKRLAMTAAQYGLNL